MNYEDRNWKKVHSSKIGVGDIISIDAHPDSQYIVSKIDRYANCYYGRLLVEPFDSKTHCFYLGPPFWFFKLVED